MCDMLVVISVLSNFYLLPIIHQMNSRFCTYFIFGISIRIYKILFNIFWAQKHNWWVLHLMIKWFKFYVLLSQCTDISARKYWGCPEMITLLLSNHLLMLLSWTNCFFVMNALMFIIYSSYHSIITSTLVWITKWTNVGEGK